MTTIVSNLPDPAVVGRCEPYDTRLQGYVRTTYAALFALMGKPHETDGDKVTVSWAFQMNNGEKFTVYDWRQYSTPEGQYDWHVGGTSAKALQAFQRFTGLVPSPA